MHIPVGTPRVVVVGSAMIDLIAKVDRMPMLGETLVGLSFQQGFGGKGANQAVMAALLGADVTFVGRLGADDFGRSTLDNLRRFGIRTESVWLDDEMPSGVAPITVDANGRNAIVIVPGANGRLTAVDVAAATADIREAHVVVCQCEVPEEADLAAFKLAKNAGAITILNPAPARPITTELLELTDVLIPNETEVSGLTGFTVDSVESARQAASLLRDRGVRSVVVTLGERGAVVDTESGVTVIKAIQVTSIDSTGAGDAFVGTLAAELGAGSPLVLAAKRANAVAALSVTRPGTQTSFPTREDAAAFLAGVQPELAW